jgi:hypothetical protein
MEMKGFVSLHKTNLDVERRVYDKKGVLWSFTKRDRSLQGRSS